MTSRNPPSSLGLDSERLDLQAGDFRVAQIHAVEVAGKQRGFVAAGARANFEDGVAILVRIGRKQRVLHGVLELRDTLFQRRDFRLRHLGHLRVRALGEFEAVAQFGARFFQPVPRREQFLQPGVLAQQILGPLRIGIKVPARDLGFEFAEAFGFFGNEWSEVHDLVECGTKQRGADGRIKTAMAIHRDGALRSACPRGKQNGEDARNAFTVSKITVRS